jgi:NAD(P)-dependent dehydrogenase (short-subunit alcohol dehydrogenase family)
VSVAGARCAVTGASSGVGAAVARELAARGAAVLGLARRLASDAPAELSPSVVVERGLDVTDGAAVARVLGAAAPLDALVIAAGGGGFGAVTELEPEAVRRLLDVHVLGALRCVKAALPGLRQRRGHIVLVSSIAVRVAFADNGAYAAAKAGQLALVRSLAEEQREHGVRVTSVILGATDTPIWDARPRFDRGAMLRADDVAAAIVDAMARRGAGVDELVLLPAGGLL